MIVNSNLSGNYYVALYSHKNYVFAQEFLDGEALSEQVCDKISNLKKLPIYGYALNKIENIQYNEEKPSAIKMIEYFNQNFESLTKKQKDINDISPIYLKKKINMSDWFRRDSKILKHSIKEIPRKECGTAVLNVGQ